MRPLNLGGLLDGSFRLFIANWRTLVIVVAAFVVPVQLLLAWVQPELPGLADWPDLFTDPAAAEQFAQAGAAGNLATLLSVVNYFLVTPLVTGVVAAVAGASYLGGTVGSRQALATGVDRWWALVASWVLLLLASTLPFFAVAAVVAVGALVGLPFAAALLVGIPLLLGALFASVAIASLCAATAPAIVVERLGPLQGLSRSVGLLRPRALAVTGVVVVAFVLVSILSAALGGPLQVAGLFMGERAGWMLVAVGGILASLVTTPWLAIVLTLLYFDARVRHEALDLHLAADELSATTGRWDGGGGVRGG